MNIFSLTTPSGQKCGGVRTSHKKRRWCGRHRLFILLIGKKLTKVAVYCEIITIALMQWLGVAEF